MSDQAITYDVWDFDVILKVSLKLQQQHNRIIRCVPECKTVIILQGLQWSFQYATVVKSNTLFFYVSLNVFHCLKL